MKNKIKAILLILAICLTSFSLGLFFLAKKIEPLAIKNKTIELLNKSYPENNFEIKDVDYSLGFSVSLFLRELNATKNESLVLKADWIEFRLPLWAVYFGGGNLDIRIVNAYVKKEKEGITAKNLGLTGIHQGLDNKTIEVPSVFSRNKINIRFINLTYDHERAYSVDTLLFKNISRKGLSAFEIIKNNQKDVLNPYDFQIVGEVNLQKLVENNETDISFFANVHNLRLHQGRFKLPDLKLSGKGALNSNGVLSASVDLKGNESIQMKFKALFNETLWKLDNIDAKIETKALFEAFLYKGSKFSFEDSSFSLKGGFDYMPLKKDIDVDLSFEISKLSYLLEKNIPLINNIEGKLLGKKLTSKIRTDLFSGVAVTDLEGVVDFKSGYKLDKVLSLSLKSSLSNIRLSQKEINEHLYREVQNKEISNKRTLWPKINWAIDGKHIFIGSDQYSVKSLVEHEETNIKISETLITGQDGELKIQGNGKVQTKDHFILNLEGKLKNSNLSSFMFLAPTWMQLNMSGKASGTTSFHLRQEGLQKDFSLNIDGKLGEGSIEGLKLSEYYSKKYPSATKVKILNEKFLKGDIKMSISNESLVLEKVRLTYAKNEDLDVHGEVKFSSSEKSKLDLNFINGKRKELPLTFNGLGKNLNPIF